MSSFPPFWRYWPLYLCGGLVIGAILVLWHSGVAPLPSAEDGGTPPLGPNAIVLFAGVCVAAAALIANSWSQWQTARIANALQSLQTLRTDREYLINVDVVKRVIHQKGGRWG
ncbi:MAG: hypothetical protein N4A39_18015 [Roseicyclus sp.]|nr:hypothetical protein [Roseicyclus sp.]